MGQDLREEIGLVEQGGSYGWSLREGSGPFGPDEAGDVYVLTSSPTGQGAFRLVAVDPAHGP